MKFTSIFFKVVMRNKRCLRRLKLGGDEHHVASSYIAPVRFEALMKNSVMEYDYYLVVGYLDQIRKEIYKIHHHMEKAYR